MRFQFRAAGKLNILVQIKGQPVRLQLHQPEHILQVQDDTPTPRPRQRRPGYDPQKIFRNLSDLGPSNTVAALGAMNVGGSPRTIAM